MVTETAAREQNVAWQAKIYKPPLPVWATVAAITAFIVLTWSFQLLLGKEAQSPQFTIWVALAAIMTITYASLFVTSIFQTKRQKPSRDKVITLGILYLVLGLVVLAFLWLVLPPAVAVLPGNAILIARGMPIVGIASMMPTVIGLWLIYPRLNDVSDSDEKKIRDSMSELRQIRTDLAKYLAVISLVVSLAVVGTGALRNALLAHNWPKDQFPASNVLLYGAFFTGILLAIYVPLYVLWRAKATAFIGNAAPLPTDNALPNETWEANTNRLTKLLGTDTTVSAHLTAAFGILAPLAASLLSVFVTEVSK